jgi:hypothetical protein
LALAGYERRTEIINLPLFKFVSSDRYIKNRDMTKKRIPKVKTMTIITSNGNSCRVPSSSCDVISKELDGHRDESK